MERPFGRIASYPGGLSFSIGDKIILNSLDFVDLCYFSTGLVIGLRLKECRKSVNTAVIMMFGLNRLMKKRSDVTAFICLISSLNPRLTT